MLFFGAVLSLVACTQQSGAAPDLLKQPNTEIPIPQQPFRIVGYITQAVVVEAIPFDQITHINYAFLIPNSDGTFQGFPNAWKLEKVVQEAHQQDVQVLISVGGWGWDDEFEAMAEDPETRAVFVDQLKRFVDQYQLDGADIDWEYPDPGESAQNFLSLIQELRAAMPDKLITTAVVSQGSTGEGVLPETLEIFDFVNIMAYDGGTPHSSYEFAKTSINYWLNRGLPPEKAVLGLPFYAHPSFVPYRKIVLEDPRAAQMDTFEYLGTELDYNGIPTIGRKTRLALEHASGVMIWTIEQDETGDLSLLREINRVISEK